MSTSFRGSRKHLLTLLDLIDPAQYRQTLNALLQGHAQVTAEDCHEPVSGTQVQEREVPDFCAKHCPTLFDLSLLDKWWLPDQPTARRPRGATWDLLSTCTVGEQPGLLLVEAKAHETELGFGGKTLASDAGDQSQANHKHIAACLASVQSRLQESGLEVTLSAESHYQLANRIAWAWKLADCGVPVVLLYLGFLGDTDFEDHFTDSDHWQRTMGVYLNGVVPVDLPGRCIPGRNGGSFTLLVESLPVPSSAKSARITDVTKVGMSDREFARVLDQVGESIKDGTISTTDEILNDPVFDIGAESFPLGKRRNRKF